MLLSSKAYILVDYGGEEKFPVDYFDFKDKADLMRKFKENYSTYSESSKKFGKFFAFYIFRYVVTYDDLDIVRSEDFLEEIDKNKFVFKEI